MSDIEELLYEKYNAHMMAYNRPPDYFELSPDMLNWLMSEINNYRRFTVDKRGVHHFMGVRIVVNYN